ncbi:hypothetical protein [Staphylococcus shinii]|uniref:hypothetical protein n=1 Tax=Staphylococcus shinii TaxID=2912228 RepID=UPI003F85BF11
MNNCKAFNQICDNVKTFIEKDNVIFDENLCCSLLYTFKGESDEFEYQVYLDLINSQIIKEISYSNCVKRFEYEKYYNWSDLAEVTKDLEFDDLYYTNMNISDLEKEVEKFQKNYREIRYKGVNIKILNANGYDNLVKMSEQNQYKECLGKYIYISNGDFICVDVLHDIACFNEEETIGEAMDWLVHII